MLPREEEKITPWQHYNMLKVYGEKEGARCGGCFHCRFGRKGYECALARGRGFVCWGEEWPACGRFVQAMVQKRLF
ncbi:MAG: hypothetical protein IT308_09455 [Anaerolineaceae bacterium]|nr:hypothetical protein [Anaerolineaceae bacterium]